MVVDVLISFTGQTIHFHPLVYGALAVVLVWGSINVTNCADGVVGITKQQHRYHENKNKHKARTARFSGGNGQASLRRSIQMFG